MEWTIVKEKKECLESVRASGPRGVLCATTPLFRTLAQSLPDELASSVLVVEIGCALGNCTEILVRKFPPKGATAGVLAVDLSQDFLLKAKERVPTGATFVVCDVLSEWGKLKRLVRDQASAGGMTDTVFFVDINGNREMDVLVKLLPILESEFHPFLIVVKSKELFRHALETGLDKQGWVKLGVLAANSFAERQMQKSKQVPTGLLALRSPKRETKDGVPICRFFNYSGCKKGERCTYDHLHCNSCGQQGHRAMECPDDISLRFAKPVQSETTTTTTHHSPLEGHSISLPSS